MGTNTVIGPITKEDWVTMRELRAWLKHTTSKNDPKYAKSIQKDRAVCKDIMDKYCKAA